MKKIIVNKHWVTLIVLGFSAIALADADGKGYNGPDLHPVSVPVQLDRGISIKQIGAAMDTCIASGDQSHGLVSMFEDVARQIGKKFLRNGHICAFLETLPPNSVVPVSCFLNSGDDLHGTVFLFSSSDNDPHPFEFGFGYDRFSHSSKEIGGGDIRIEIEHFPLIKYESVLQDGLDDYGRPVSENTIVSGLAIQVDSDFDTVGAKLRVKNLNGGYAKFTVNGKEYVQCLQAEIQRQVGKTQ